MENYYKLLDIKPGASASEIKKAFRKKAKQLHPDLAGSSPTQSEAMQKLLYAYESLLNLERRFESDRKYSAQAGFGFRKKSGFNYRQWLKEQGDPQSIAKLIFYDLMRLEEDIAIKTWRENGGLDFALEKHMDRDDWMDCQYILAEELDKRGFSYEAFKLMTALLVEERRRPYFKLFTEEIYLYVKSIVRNRLKPLPAQDWIACMEALIGIGFSAYDENKFKESIAKTLKEIRAKQ